MAKTLDGDLQVVSANRLGDGVVVFLDDALRWVPELARAAVARDKDSATLLLERGRAEAAGVVEPFLVAVAEEGSVLEPLSLRERIRASGLTFQTIAAEAVRYA
jgi:hypothetical protein